MASLRPEQRAAVGYVEGRLSQGCKYTLLASPTGSGKSYVENAVKSWDRYIVSPRVEILESMCEKAGITGNPEDSGYFTPIRLRNLLAKAEVPQPAVLIVDEVHHDTCDSYEELEALAGFPLMVGFTATPYRGTPKGTKALLDKWGEPQWVITYQQASTLGYISVPTFETVPLVDDDTITVANGEFVVSSSDAAIGDAVTGVVELVQSRGWCEAQWDRPTMFSVPSVESAKWLRNGLINASIPVDVILADTRDRAEIFDRCVNRQTVIVQINVVSEGVDLPIRRLIDLQPTMSPVRWIQGLGRIMRPSDRSPEYVGCCRNLLRHSYLLDGLVPGGAVATAEKAFGGIGERRGLRVLGFENFGRFKATELPLLDNTTGLMYCLSAVQGTKVKQYAILTTPHSAEPICAERINVRQGDYGKWTRCDMPSIDKGFSSVPPYRLTDNQAAWWKRCAGTRGLNPDAEVNARTFQALPVLFNIGAKL